MRAGLAASPQYSGESLAGYLVFREECLNSTGDFFAVRFKREVSGVQEMRLQILQVAAVGRSAFWWKDEIVFSPHNQSRRLILAEEILKFRVQRDVGAVVVHEVHLDIAVSGAVETNLIKRPSCRVEQRQITDAILVLPAG